MIELFGELRQRTTFTHSKLMCVFVVNARPTLPDSLALSVDEFLDVLFFSRCLRFFLSLLFHMSVVGLKTMENRKKNNADLIKFVACGLS